MAKILRIIMIDSLCRGEKAEIMLDGNTSLTGTNGIGKSSILRLIPVFYGAAPGSVVKSDGNNKSFADWYLPNESSFIIFEYLNYENATCCTILHRTSTGYAYRLVSGSWDNNLLYLDTDAGLLVSPQNIVSHVQRQQRTCSPAIPTGSYRRIIQFNTGTNDLDGIDDLQQRKLIEHNQRLFSLAPRRQEFAGIDTVTLAMINEGHSFESIGLVMADILQQTHGGIETVLESIRHQPIQNLLQNIESFNLYEREVKSKIDSLDDLLGAYQAKTFTLRRSKRRSMILQSDLTERIERINTAITTLDEQKREQDEFADNQRKDLSQSIGKAESDFSGLEQDVGRIERQRDGYAAKNMDAMEAFCQQAPAIEQERQQKQMEVDQYNQQGADVRLKFEGLKDAAKQGTQRLIDEEQSTARANENEIERRQKTQRQEAQSRRKRIVEEHTTKNNAFAIELQQARTDLTRQQETLTQLKGFGVLPQDQTAINDAIALADQNRALHDAQQSVVKGLDEQLHQIKIERDVLSKEKSGLERERSKQHALKDQAVATLNAKGNTLLGFLRAHYPDWVSNIAKLVPENILMRSDLNPELLAGADSAKSLYGIVVSLDHIDTPSFANTDLLRDDIARLDSEVQRLDDELGDLDKRSRKLEGQIKEAEHGLSQQKQVLARLKSDLDTSLSAIEGLRQRAVSHFQAHIDKLQAQVNDQLAELERLRTRDEENKSAQGRQLIEIDSMSECQDNDNEAELAALRESTDLRIQQHKDRLAETLREYELGLNKALTEAGIDDTRNRKLQRDLKQLTETLEEIKRNILLVHEYTRWKQDTLPGLESLIADMSEAEAVRDSLIAQRDQLEKQNAKRQDTYRTRQRENKAERDQLESELASTQRLLDLLDFIEPDEEATLTPGQRIADIDEDARQALNARAKVSKQARSLYSEITNAYRNRGLHQSPHSNTIDSIEREARRETEVDDMRWLVAADLLKSSMESFHIEQRNKLITLATQLSSTICDSKGRLEHLHQSIMKLGREATERASAVAVSFPSIESIEFVVRSNIRDLEFWADLDNYEKQYQRWRGLGEDTLPTEAFISALERFELRLRGQKLSKRIVDCFSVHIELTDKGERKRACNNSQFNGVTSEGLRKIVLCMLFLSLFELLRKEADLTLIIPLDESLKLKAQNYISLVDSFNQRSTVAFAACPDPQPELLSQFQNVYSLKEEATGIKVIQYATSLEDEIWSEEEMGQLYEAHTL
mgnify:CR=1 FL=1